MMKKKAAMKTKPSFAKLSKAQQRIAIARDVLKQFKRKVYLARFCYVRLPYTVGINQRSVAESKECHVCAAGAACLSAIRLGNVFNFKASGLGELTTFRIIDKWFPKGTGKEIQAYYEGFFYEAKDHERCQAVCSQNPNKNDRLIWIFKNIIAHKGQFVP